MRRLLPILLVLSFAGQTQAYYPPNCMPGHAAKDYTDSDAVVIARVIKIERKVSDFFRKNGEKKYKAIAYWATLKVARVVRGGLKKDEEIEMYDGGYLQVDEDNLKVNFVGQCNYSHSRAGFHADGIYVLFLKQSKDDDGKLYWAPRSCHFSIHKVDETVDEKTDTLTTVVRESLGQRAETKPPVALDAFLEAKKNEADGAKAAENENKK